MHRAYMLPNPWSVLEEYYNQKLTTGGSLQVDGVIIYRDVRVPLFEYLMRNKYDFSYSVVSHDPRTNVEGLVLAFRKNHPELHFPLREGERGLQFRSGKEAPTREFFFVRKS